MRFLGAVGRPFGLHVAAIEEQAGGAIFRQEARPEIRRQTAEAALAPHIQLPQPFPRHREALGEKHIVPRVGANMRNAPAIEHNLRRLLQPRGGHGDAIGSGHAQIPQAILSRRVSRRDAIA